MSLSDFNVPLDPLGRYMSVGESPAWVIQKMNSGVNFDGTFPSVSSVLQRPVVSAGQTLWSALATGGLFTFQGVGKAILISDTYSKNATFTSVILTPSGGTRTMPATPFRLGAGEKIQVTSTGVSGVCEIGFLASLDGDR